MKRFFGRLDGVLGGLLMAASAVGCVHAQTHRVEKTEVVVRAVGVYEWTGDMAKPTASRLIPVSLFIDDNLQDAGVYLARPVPFALLTGNVYELDQAGIAKGTLDLVYSRHLQALDAKSGDAMYDDGWFGYGAFKAAAPPKPAPALRRSKTLATLTSNSSDTSKPALSDKTSGTTTPTDPDRPTMKRRTDDSASTAPAATTPAPTSTTSTASTPADDPDRPTMKRRNTDDASSGTTASTPATPSTTDKTSSTASAGSVPADDPDRPTMKRRSTDDSASSTTPASTGSSGSTNSTANSTPADDPDRPTLKRRSDDSSSGSTTTASTGNVPADDPDRPTLKRRTPEEMKQARKEAGMSSVTGVGSLNDDPNRPKLHYGKPVGSMTSEDLPQLKGMPTVEVHQLVAVSDAKDREPHDFARPWEDEEEHKAVLAKMEAMARTQLTAYEAKTTPTPPAPVKKAPVSRTAVKKKPVPPPPPEMLSDVQLKGYLLSYGGSPVYVYQAHTAGTGAALRYVTVVAQPDGAGELKPALQSVTDAAHLDRTPLLRLVDAVDVQASNRASLLFEMRSQSSRQFALYRVIGARADQIFLTGTTQ